MPARPLSRLVPALLLAATLAAAGCGERDFDAGSIVDELNGAGAGLKLGQTLPATDDGAEVHVVELPGTAGAGTGALVVLDGTDAAREEFQRCESVSSFVCFRAANAVLRFSEITPAQQRRLTRALRTIESAG